MHPIWVASQCGQSGVVFDAAIRGREKSGDTHVTLGGCQDLDAVACASLLPVLDEAVKKD
jgi:hypothetical protein